MVRTELPESNRLNVTGLSCLFNNMSESYKIFWFRSLFDAVKEGKREVTFDELINHMIVDAWYMVSEYKLSLGPSDNLERLILHLHQLTRLKPSEKQSVIETVLRSLNDPDYKRMKGELIKFVPYRLQAPLMPDMRGKEWDVSTRALAQKINSKQHLIYYFDEYNGMNTRIVIQDDWFEYLHSNQSIIEGWIEYNMIDYLQRRNPSVPGIINKLYPPEKRQLEDIKKLWKACVMIHPIDEIYLGQRLDTNSRLSIDHFIPWSYVAHDELWNLHPTTVSINSSKSNFLPDWDSYFDSFSHMEYTLYSMAHQYETVRSEYVKCLKKHVNDTSVMNSLYADGLSEPEFLTRLDNIIHPVYTAAQNQGFIVRTNIGI